MTAHSDESTNDERVKKQFTGSCHCGAVRFGITGARPIVVCHCRDCMRLGGFSWAATACRDEDFVLFSDKNIVDWYASSALVKRGFCRQCHAHMFYKKQGDLTISIAVGMLEDTGGLHISGQWFDASLPEACRHVFALTDRD